MEIILEQETQDHNLYFPILLQQEVVEEVTVTQVEHKMEDLAVEEL